MIVKAYKISPGGVQDSGHSHMADVELPKQAPTDKNGQLAWSKKREDRVNHILLTVLMDIMKTFIPSYRRPLEIKNKHFAENAIHNGYYRICTS